MTGESRCPGEGEIKRPEFSLHYETSPLTHIYDEPIGPDSRGNRDHTS